MIDLTQQGMGLRCKRFVCILEGGMVTHTRVGDEVGPVSAAAVEKVLEVSSSSGPRNDVSFNNIMDRNGEPRTPETATSTAENPDLLPVRVNSGKKSDGFIREVLLLPLGVLLLPRTTLLDAIKDIVAVAKTSDS